MPTSESFTGCRPKLSGEDEAVAGARFVDCPRAEGVDVLGGEQPVVLLQVSAEAWNI